jgi:oligoendopeptidase F
MAANAGFRTYRDFAWARLRRFDYTPEQCLEFHTAIESEVLPVVREINQRRRAMLGVETLRPWDLEVDPSLRAPLRPFTTTAELMEIMQRLLNRLDDDFALSFDRLRQWKLLDLENRPGKAPCSYEATLNEARLPFIFMHAVGAQCDVQTLLHECGHAFHALATQCEPLLAYRTPPIEMCEMASTIMELLGSENLDEIYSPADARRARRELLESVLGFFPWLATVDAFQHWIYSHPGHTSEERSETWVALVRRFQSGVDWSGYEFVRANLWHEVAHIFENPFYFIEYGIAWLGAWQFRLDAARQRNRQEALAAYMHALSLGGSRPLPELLAAIGCKLDFSASAVRRFVSSIRDELDQLTS